MPRDALIAALRQRFGAAQALERDGRHRDAFALLEEAHVLSQRLTLWHCRVHWRMWRNGLARRDWREVLGQSTRIPAALLFSRLWVPAGNTGGARVNALAPMPIPPSLQALLDR